MPILRSYFYNFDEKKCTDHNFKNFNNLITQIKYIMLYQISIINQNQKVFIAIRLHVFENVYLNI